jgi:hypothetical protein
MSTLNVKKHIVVQPSWFFHKILVFKTKKSFIAIFLLEQSFAVFKNCGLTPLEELYGLTNLLINLDRSLCESIDFQEVSTLNVKKYIPSAFLVFSQKHSCL